MCCLGLDLSTTMCGFAFTDNKKIIDAGYIDISKKNDILDKIQFILYALKKRNIDISFLNLEAPLSGFSGGRMKQQIIIKLVKINTLTEYIISKEFGVPVQLVSATTARKQLFGKSRIAGVNPKIYVKNELEKLYNISQYITYNRNGNINKGVEDLFDAIVISLYKK